MVMMKEKNYVRVEDCSKALHRLGMAYVQETLGIRGGEKQVENVVMSSLRMIDRSIDHWGLSVCLCVLLGRKP